MLLLFALHAVHAQDDDGASLTYEGGLSGSGAAYARGKPITITHSSGNVEVRCMDVDKLSGRLQYTVFGSAEGAMEAFGSGIGLSVWGDANGGGAKTRVPSKTSGVARAQVDLKVNVPKGTTSLTVSQAGAGWVQVQDCSGNVKVTAGAGGAYVSGALTGFTVTATGGDVKVVPAAEGVVKNSSSASAPGGNVSVVFTAAQAGKLSARGAEVSVQQSVIGSTTPTLVTGELGATAGPGISLSAKGRVEVTQH